MNLRDRIAAAVERGISDTGPGDFGAVADAVIAELGLIRDPFSTVAFHRYVTKWAPNGPEWKADDE